MAVRFGTKALVSGRSRLLVSAPSGPSAVNLVPNPRAGLNITGWTSVAGTGGTRTSSRVATGGPIAEAPTFYRVTWSVSPTGAPTAYVDLPVLPSTQYRASFYVRPSWAGAALALSMIRYNGGTFQSAATGATQLPAANAWARHTLLAASAAGTTTFRVQINCQAGGAMPPVGATLDVTGMMLHLPTVGDVQIPYRDGDVAGWSWTGAAHASPSSGPITL